MSAPNYIPTRLAERVTWMGNFQAYVNSNYAALGLSLTDATNISNAIDLFLNAYYISSVAETRTPATVADTQTKDNYAQLVVRPFAQLINASANTTDFQRAALQITIRATGKTPIPAPLTYPVLTPVNATPLNMKLKFQDSDAILTKVKAKPFGVAALELRQHTGATPPATPDDAAFVGLITKSPFAVEQDPANIGQTAYYYGRWVTARGLVGPWSAVATMTVAG